MAKTYKGYPRALSIICEHGDGEAFKETPHDPWTCSFYHGGMRFYGGEHEMKAEARRRHRPDKIRLPTSRSLRRSRPRGFAKVKRRSRSARTGIASGLQEM